jgi:hypothetical protein
MSAVLPTGNEVQLLAAWCVALGLDGQGSELQLLQKLAGYYQQFL